MNVERLFLVSLVLARVGGLVAVAPIFGGREVPWQVRAMLVLALAAVQQLDWFLWMAALGSHVFWMIALALQRRAPRPPNALR